MATIKYAAPASAETVLTTELNSIANGAGGISGTAVSNDAAGELYLYANIELSLAAQGAARSAGAYCEIYILPEVDGTNYSYGGASLKPAMATRVAVLDFDAATTARRAIAMGVPLPPTDFHMLVWNATGQAFAASGNTLKIERYNLASA
jgi:hypothetical protein